MARKKKIEEEAQKVDESALSPAELKKLRRNRFVSAVDKQKGSVQVRKASTYQGITRLSTGILSLDLALGGGLPQGRVTVFAGNKSCSKTTTALKVVANIQKKFSICNKYDFEVESDSDVRLLDVPYSAAWIDMEGCFDVAWAEANGVNLDELDISVPGVGEEAVDILQGMISSLAYDLIVLDSLAQIEPKAEYEASAYDQQQAVAARLINKMFRKIQTTQNINSNQDPNIRLPTIILINQLREKTGVVYGSNKVMPGGKGQEFGSSVIVYFSGNKVEYYDQKDKTMPKTTDIDFFIEKNKTAPPKVSGGYKMFLVEDENEGYGASEVFEHKYALKMAENVGLLERPAQGKYTLMGEEFKKQGDLIEKYVNNPENFLLLKREILRKRYPKDRI